MIQPYISMKICSKNYIREKFGLKVRTWKILKNIQ